MHFDKRVQVVPTWVTEDRLYTPRLGSVLILGHYPRLKLLDNASNVHQLLLMPVTSPDPLRVPIPSSSPVYKVHRLAFRPIASAYGGLSGIEVCEVFRYESGLSEGK